MDYLYRALSATERYLSLKPAVIDRFEKVKLGKYAKSVVERAYDNMVRVGLIPG